MQLIDTATTSQSQYCCNKVCFNDSVYSVQRKVIQKKTIKNNQLAYDGCTSLCTGTGAQVLEDNRAQHPPLGISKYDYGKHRRCGV